MGTSQKRRYWKNKQDNLIQSKNEKKRRRFFYLKKQLKTKMYTEITTFDSNGNKVSETETVNDVYQQIITKEKVTLL